jgi:peptidoglycan hydrolase-like protein with peptidoglycan-binding domain
MTVTAKVGIYVRAMQKLLITAGMNPADHITGLYDQTTIEQIKAFQAKKGLPQNGVVDGATWHQLQAPGCGGA